MNQKSQAKQAKQAPTSEKKILCVVKCTPANTNLYMN